MNMRKGIPTTEFGERLRELRREKGLTQVQLAELAGISARMIGHYEIYVKMPPLTKVKMLAEALGVTSDELIGTSKKTKEKLQEEEISHRIMKRVKIIEKLPVRDQKAIFRIINTMAEKHNIK